METGLLLQLVINGLSAGLIYALVATGLTLLFGIMLVINFAHGEFYMLGGFFLYYAFHRFAVQTLHLPILPAYFGTLVVIFVVVGSVGFFVEKAIFRPFRGIMNPAFVLSLGLSLFLQTAALSVFGSTPKGVPSVFTGHVALGSATITVEKLFISIVSLALIGGLYVFMKRTKLGLALRATTQDRVASELQGVNYGAICSLGFGLGTGLAGLAAGLVTPVLFVDPYAGAAYIMKAFIIIIVGGLGSIAGAVAGGLILGMVESFVSYFVSLPAAYLVSFLMVIGVLLFRPEGLLRK